MAKAIVTGYRPIGGVGTTVTLEVSVVFIGLDVRNSPDLSLFNLDVDLGTVLTAASVHAAIAAGVEADAARFGYVLVGAPGVRMVIPAFGVN